ncbi:MerR family transcriptional regulator [Terasakiella sp. A23]|uniref:MerR family transcriptional regulator n=1 Tax=Terasakiella sp. FCG-A23 TaxID=3080561 RepID=UPI002954D01F|nr:MerR family transcriptional regulator [Terasakiella sp. A23]MDV7338642.1 MerR family transcriptional regulator [Terasakiella sp. A23]
MTDRSDKSADAFRTISEVAKELGLATHVLRFWESKFPQIKPLKRAGGRRYYRPDDVALLRRLQSLLHDEGYTIKGVQKLFREEGARKFIDEGNAAPAEAEDVDVLAPASPQASLFDQPASTAASQPVAAPTVDDVLNNAVALDDTPSDTYIKYSPDLLPDAPEPEPITDPAADTVEAPVTVVKQGLNDDQRSILEEVLSELKSIKEQIDQAA